MKKLIWLLLLLAIGPIGWGEEAVENPPITITSQLSLPIGIKIWFNECYGTIEGLTTWNAGEDFASLGIGHFIWHPYPSKHASFTTGFPALVAYIRQRGGTIPPWLQGQALLYCPWSNRSEFIRAKNSPRMIALRTFLQQTIPIQAEYMTLNLHKILPRLIEYTPPQDRQFIYDQFHILARTPSGIYALVDYLNFKGAGISDAPHNYEHGTGLLQVLKGMRDAPPGSTPLRAYVWSAKQALIKRVRRAAPHKRYDIWLNGWFKRLDTYLEGDLVNLQVVP